MATIFKNKKSRIWLIVTAALVALMLVVTILTQTMFYSFLCLVLDRPKPVYKEGALAMYSTDTVGSKKEAKDFANKKTVELCEEGFVLLKNNESALPLDKNAKVSVFGKNSVNLSYGGSGSSAFTDVTYKTIYDSLEEAGFKTNPTLKNFYENDKLSGSKRAANSDDLDSGGNQMIATAETPQSKYTDNVKDSYSEWNDAALIVITRIGGEGFDLPRYQGTTAGAVSADSHYLELDANERELITAVCDAGFKKVVVLFNIPSAMEATFLEDTSYLACADKIDAALWFGFTGGEGIMALGSILCGDVTPSGRTVDTWSADFTKDPTFVNFGTGNTDTTKDCYQSYDSKNDKWNDLLYYFVDYEEGIYVGYRYYETRSLVENQKEGATKDEWYEANVVYPFGYGLSYTNFEWTTKSAKTGTITKNGKIEIEVEVKNIGTKYSGKDVVEVYAQAPYDAEKGGIEKASKVLVGYAKTDELAANGGMDTVKIEIDPYYFASYDYRDANKNGFYGYELEKGEYKLYISQNAHDVVDEITLTLAEDIKYETDNVTNNKVGNRFTKEGSVTATDITKVSDSDMQLSTVLSRTDFEETFPTANTQEERNISKELLAEIQDVNHNNPTNFEECDPVWFGEEAIYQVTDLLPLEQPEASHLPIIPYGGVDEYGNDWDEIWTVLLSQCTEAELINLYNYGAYETKAVGSINMPATICSDGPAGFTCFMNKQMVNGTCHYCSEPVIASTWNDDLVESLGETMGDEALMGDGNTPYSALYAPGVNIHRSQFGGRCAEYFSEDGFLSGKIAAAQIRGAQRKGLIMSVKHFAANEQETHRSISGDLSWLTEQSLREIYLKSFEIAVKEGATRSVMSSFNRIGTKWTGGDYRLLTEILRDEWGFKGMVICDFNTIPKYMNSRQMAYAGGDINLTQTPVSWCDPNDMGDSIMLQQSAKNLIYTFVNSNAMKGEVDHYNPPVWVILLYVVEALIVVGLTVWGFFALRQTSKGGSVGVSKKATRNKSQRK